MRVGRSLLALFSVHALGSVAYAADAVVVAEPEPIDYVRICDTYGVGFYYIPGTETCLKVSGYIRYDIGAKAFGLTDVADKNDPAPPWYQTTDDTYDKRVRFQLRVDARSETELGSLRAYAAINFDADTFTTDPYDDFYYNNGETTTGDFLSIQHAYLELGGFRVGKTDSLFSTFTGYAGGVLNDDVIGYGPYGTLQIAYGWGSEDGFGAAIALEAGDGDLVAPFLAPSFGEPDLYTIDSYVPHIVAGVGWQGAWGGASVVAGYDSVWKEGAVKARVDFYPTDRLALFAMAGWASYDEDYEDPTFPWWSGIEIDDSPNYYAPWGGRWAVWGGGSFMATDKATINVQVSYDDFEDFSVVANVAYEVVPNFVVTPEIAYIDNFNDELDEWLFEDFPTENWGFFLRAQANFGG